MLISPGTRLGTYEIIAPIGAGGMGEVYRAHDSKLDRDVAVKVLPEHLSENKDSLGRFEREAKTVAALSHPNILAIHDFGHAEDVTYAVMELLEGETLRQRLDFATLPLRKAVDLALQMAQGMAAAHDKGVTHRDLKPENVFITVDGRLKILDFGLAKVIDPKKGESESATLSRQTSPGNIMGTMGYMSPEQVRGVEADHRSDIFSFGTILYEMLSGERAFHGESAADTMSAILKEDPEDGRRLPPALERILRRCLEKRAEERFQSARDLGFALEAISDVAEPKEVSGTKTASGSEKASSVAVLPFTNMSSDKEQDYFCEGMAEEIINALAKIGDLSVASRTSAFQFREGGEDLKRIGDALNVKTVLEGSVRTAGNRLRVVAKLVNVDNGYPIWSERYDKEMADVFAIQDEISENIVRALEIKLTDRAQQKRHLPNLEAYQLYLKGLYTWNQHYKDSVERAMRFFEQAAAADPTFALAYVGEAIAYVHLAQFGVLPARKASEKAKAAVERALAIDDNLAESRAAAGLVHQRLDFEWAAAERDFKRALELNPKYVLAYSWYADLLYAVGRFDEAIAMALKGRELDPLSPLANGIVGTAYLLGGDYERAALELERALELDANFVLALINLGVTLACAGSVERAVSLLERAAAVGGRAPLQLATLAYGYGMVGRRSDAESILKELRARAEANYVSPILFSWTYIGCGQKDRAFEWLEKGYEERAPLVNYMAYPVFDDLRSDPRFHDMLRRMDLVNLIQKP